MCLDVQSVTLVTLVPTNWPTQLPSTLSTATISSTDTSAPSGPSIATIAGATTAAIAAIFLGVVAIICWRRRNKNKRTHQERRRGFRGGSKGWGKGVDAHRTDTIKSFFVGREEGDESSTGLLSGKSQRSWTSQQLSDSRVRYAGLGARAARPTFSANEPIPPQPPPSHLKPKTLIGIREDRMRSAPVPATSAPPIVNPFATPSHSPSGSYDDRYPDGISPTNSLPSTGLSLATPFSGGRPFPAWEGNTPPSSISSPGGLQRTWPPWEHRAATEGNAPHTLAASATALTAAPHSASGPTATGEAGKSHRRTLTIDTTNIHVPRRSLEIQRPLQGSPVAATGVPSDPKRVSSHAHDVNPPTALTSAAPHENPLPNPEEDAAASLGKMFTSATSPSDYEIHESMPMPDFTSPTDGGFDAGSPLPESATLEMYGINIGFGVMGRKWEPRNSDANSSSNPATRSSSKKSMRGMRTPASPRRVQSLTKAAVPSASASPSSGTKTPPTPTWRPPAATPSGQPPPPSSSGRNSETSTGTISSLLDGYGAAPSPAQVKDTIFELDEDAPVPTAAAEMDEAEDAPTPPVATPRRGGDAFGSGETQAQAQKQGAGGQGQSWGRGRGHGSPLTPRRAPPRRSVAPEDFSEEGLGALSREDTTRRWW